MCWQQVVVVEKKSRKTIIIIIKNFNFFFQIEQITISVATSQRTMV